MCSYQFRLIIASALCFFSSWASPAFAQSSATLPPDTQKLLQQIEQLQKQAWAFSNSGLDQSSSPFCAKAEPIYRQAYSLLADKRASDHAFDNARSNVGSSLGRCLIAEHRESEAATILEQSLTATWNSDAQSHLMLASLYAEGKGVKQDTVKALGHFMLGNNQVYDGGGNKLELSRVRRQMAELLLQNRDSYSVAVKLISSEAQQLLQQGEIKNWMRYSELRYGTNQSALAAMSGDNKTTLARLQFEALDKGFVSDQEDQADAQKMRLNLGRYFLENDAAGLSLPESQAVSWYFLNASGMADARADLLKLNANLPYKLVLPNGELWSAVDVSH
ncbi:hypothetical protein [Paraburkholderia bannensis]|uniref:hypothetical protein n=1 Tax=Paraburkholderia bannensis TaxID=765414 RepID=UPI002ABDC372|nr:hypothetical protein [Paraburkholderia bannensis]